MSGVQLVSGFVTDPIPSLPKPAKGEAFTEPTYKTCVVRVTDHAVEPPSGFAYATPCPVMIALPTQRATTSPPIRPIQLAAPISSPPR